MSVAISEMQRLIRWWHLVAQILIVVVSGRNRAHPQSSSSRLIRHEAKQLSTDPRHARAHEVEIEVLADGAVDSSLASLAEQLRPAPDTIVEGDVGAAGSFLVVDDDEVEFECPGPPAYMLESVMPGASGPPELTTRETLWALRHLGMIAPSVADSFLKLERHGDKRDLRRAVGDWVVGLTCSDSHVCATIASHLSRGDGFAGCPLQRVLAVVQSQLEDSWRSTVLTTGFEFGDAGVAGFTAPQLAVMRWGLSVLNDRGGEAAGLAARERAVMHLENLVSAMTRPGGDLLKLTRSFLEKAEEWQAVRNSTDSFIPLLRLMQSHRLAATPATLVRDAAVAEFSENRVRELEARFHGLLEENFAASALPLEMGASDIGNATHAMHAMLEHLQNISDDHVSVLPEDFGVLPAFWIGRLNKLQRRVEDRSVDRRTPRQTVLIWTCSYGGGHWAATKALVRYLPDYNVVISDTSKDPEYYENDSFGDWMREHLLPNWDDTYTFNEIVLRQRKYWLENMMEQIQAWQGWLSGTGTRFAKPCPAPLCDDPRKRLFRRAFLRAAPDLVVTVYHMDLLPILELCEELGGVPLLHLATDIDAKMWEVFSSRPSFPHFRVGLPFDVSEANSTIAPLDVAQTFLSGYAVRPGFLKPVPAAAEVDRLKTLWGIPHDAQVVLVMSGSEGQAVPWPSLLAESETWGQRPLHVVVVVGRNTDFGNDLERRYNASIREVGSVTSEVARVNETADIRLLHGPGKHVTLEVARGADAEGSEARPRRFPFYLPESQLVDLMDVADVLITKAGGSTTAEAAYRGTPVLFDAVDGMLKWEAFTADVFEGHGRGMRLASADELEEKMRRVIGLGRSRTLVAAGRENSAVNTTERIRAELARMEDLRRRSPFLRPVQSGL